MKKTTFPVKLHSFWVLLLGASLLFFSFRAVDDFFEISKNLDIFTSVYREINLNYVDEVSSGDLMRNGIAGMLTTLDPYTEFIPEEDIERFKINYVSTQYGGIGALMVTRNNKLYIAEIYEGFPAWESGLQAGDQLISIDGVLVTNLEPAGVSDLLKGSENSMVKLIIKRPFEEKSIEKKIKRDKIYFDNVSYFGMLNEETGYIKLDKFLEKAAQEVKNAFNELKHQKKMKSLVLDLRGNGGGILQEAVKIVNLFVDNGDTVVVQGGRKKSARVVYRAKGFPIDKSIPIVVLVDSNTASAAEIVAGALQDFDRATIVGQRTFGKGLVQQTLRMPYNTLLKMTIAKYYTPSGRCIQAIDYSHHDNYPAMHIPDSLINEFYTQNGRKVYDNSGIYPDIVMATTQKHTITQAIVNEFYYFDYATKFKNEHHKIADVSEFSVTPTIYLDFTQWLDEQNFTYSTTGERLLNRLKENSEQESRFDAIKPEYNALFNKLKHDKSQDLIVYQAEIKKLLESEIAARYYFQKGRMLSSLKYDKEVEKAVDVLNNDELYSSILAGEGKFKIIGQPATVWAQHKKSVAASDKTLEEAVIITEP